MAYTDGHLITGTRQCTAAVTVSGRSLRLFLHVKIDDTPTSVKLVNQKFVRSPVSNLYYLCVGDCVMHLCPICNRRTRNVLDDDDDDDVPRRCGTNMEQFAS